jgi:CheY-like chemotaxis protein
MNRPQSRPVARDFPLSISGVTFSLSRSYHRAMLDVLIVDDDVDSREAMCGFLEKFGCSVECVSSGREAIAALGKVVPGVIVLDWMMPRMDGLQFLEIIRSYLNWSLVPVILVTGYDGPHVAKAKAMGVDRVFLKGNYELAELLACVRQFSHQRGRPIDPNPPSISEPS